MNNINAKILENVPIQEVHSAFLDAFSDYPVKSPLSLQDFQRMMKRRGFSSALSVGAFTEPKEQMVGFILNGMREWDGKLTAYDTGTGVSPSYRKQGITNELFNEVVDILATQGVEQYLLEVLKQNTVAYEIYKKQGFTVNRTFSVFQLLKDNACLDISMNGITQINGIEPNEWELLKSFWDFSPSWQNSIDSVIATSGNYAYIIAKDGTECVGYGIIEKETGDVPQISVKHSHRNKGVGSCILAALMQHTQSAVLRFVNIDDTCESLIGFLNQIGAEIIGGQYEMLLPTV